MFKGVTLRRLSIACVFFAGGFIEILNSARDVATEVGMDLPIVAPAAIWAIFMVMIIASIGMNDRIQARAGWLAPAFRMLGLMTYPLYLFHQTVGTALMRTLHNLGMPRFVTLFLAAAVCIFISAIIAAAFEPLLKQRLRPVFARIAEWLDRNKRMAFLFQATTPVYESFPAVARDPILIQYLQSRRLWPAVRVRYQQIEHRSRVGYWRRWDLDCEWLGSINFSSPLCVKSCMVELDFVDSAKLNGLCRSVLPTARSCAMQRLPRCLFMAQSGHFSRPRLYPLLE